MKTTAALLSVLLAALAADAAAQVRGCPGIEFTDREKIAIQYRMWERLQGYRPRAARTKNAGLQGAIPVAFHVIHDGDEGWVPMERIEEQIEVLNAAYAPAGFVLAHIDYTDNPEWFRMSMLTRAEWNCKHALALDHDYYLNVYTCDPGPRLLGWAIFPFLAEYVPVIDGATVLYSSLPGGGEFGYEEGDTLVHEVGHWAGLFHTFQGRCGRLGDVVADTPPEQTPAYGCEEGRDTCFQPGLDPIHNYMDYSNDACATHFTPGQFARMATSLAAFRPVIWDFLVNGLPGSNVELQNTQ